MTHLTHLEKIRALAANARMIAIGGTRTGSASQITWVEAANGKPIGKLEVPSHVLGLSINDKNLWAACADGFIRVFSLESKKETHAFLTHSNACTAVVLSRDSARIATVGHDGYLRVWSTTKNEKLNEWKLSTSPLRAVAIDPAGDCIAAAGDDGIVYSVEISSGNIRAMKGHNGVVYALAFTPRDGRLISAGEDSILRIWYLVGEVEFETRGEDDSGHKGAVYALQFLPNEEKESTQQETSERFVSAGADGCVKMWNLNDRRKPRMLESNEHSLYAVALSIAKSSKSMGALFVGGENRYVYRLRLDVSGLPGNDLVIWHHGFEQFSVALNEAKPAREAAIKALAPLEEPEALELMLRALQKDREYELRALAASFLGLHMRRGARAALRERLNDDHEKVRLAAFDALYAIDAQMPLNPLRAALESRFSDVRVKALRTLVELKGTSPLIPSMIISQLKEPDWRVHRTALYALRMLYPTNNPEPLIIAYDRGTAEIKVEVLTRAFFAALLSTSHFSSIVGRALDDENSNVRLIAFTLKVLEHPALAHVLETKDPNVEQMLLYVARLKSFYDAEETGQSKTSANQEFKANEIPNEEVQKVRAQIMGDSSLSNELSEHDREPLLAAMACRHPETALRGAKGLAQLGDTRALGALLQLSREVNPALRKQAASALQDLHDARSRKRLVWMLNDQDASVRATAFDAYAKLTASEPIELASAALHSSHEDIRVRGLSQLVQLGGSNTQPSEATLELLANAIEDEASKVRNEAFRTLWAWNIKEPQKAIDRAIEARFPDLRLQAIKELEVHGKEAWAQDRLLKLIADRNAEVALASYETCVKLMGKEHATTHLAALASTHSSLRIKGAKGAVHTSIEQVRSPLMKQLQDEHVEARISAIETLDKLLPKESGPLYAGLQSNFYDLKVRSAELLAIRHDEQLIDTMRAFLSDKTLSKCVEPAVLAALRYRAASALATLGSSRTVKYFALELIKDEDSNVREQAARGLATAVQRGEEGYLLDLMGHEEISVRSWVAEGLARRGDARALPVLTGTLKHDHRPIRVGAILSFVALGPEGYDGVLQGLEDPSKEVEDIVFSVILARDLRAFRRGESPDLLTSALSAKRPEIRFSAARALELRVHAEHYLAHLIEVLLPPKPEKNSEMKDWPTEESRGRLMVAFASALANDDTGLRYAAAQALRLRNKPIEFFREVSRAVKLRPASQSVTPYTELHDLSAGETKPAKGWLRRLFSKDDASIEEINLSASEQKKLRELAFGAYVGLLRQEISGDEDGHRVRRDAIDRIVALSAQGYVSSTAAIPTLVRALDDGHNLVRKASFLGLKSLFKQDSDEPLSLALRAKSADIARTALDELSQRGETSRSRIEAALNSSLPEVRQYAFELLERMSPKDSLDPLLAALSSEYSDIRVGVIARLADSNDARVHTALLRATESEHDDLRLRAAELLALRKEDQAVEVLAAFLRSDNTKEVARARTHLTRLGSSKSIAALNARLEEVEPAARIPLIKALGDSRTLEALPMLASRLSDESEEVRKTCFESALDLTGRDVKKRNHVAMLEFLRAAVQCKDPLIRARAANELEYGDEQHTHEPGPSILLQSLFKDREASVRIAAVTKYAKRVIEKNASVEPLEQIVREESREILLPAAEGVASRGLVSALRPLLLFVRAGESGERERALIALGALGDTRAREELETIASGGTEEAPADISMQAAAIEGLGRLISHIKEVDVRRRVLDKIEQSVEATDSSIRLSALRALRWVGGERSRILIENTLTSTRISNETIQVEAAQLLGDFGDVAAEVALAKALEQKSLRVRTEARKALEKLFPSDRTRIEFLAVTTNFTDISEPAANFLAKEGDVSQLIAKLSELKNDTLRQTLRYGLLRRSHLPIVQLAKMLEKDVRTRIDSAWLIGSWLAKSSSNQTLVPSESERTQLHIALLHAERECAADWLKHSQPTHVKAWLWVLWAASIAGVKELVTSARSILSIRDRKVPIPIRIQAIQILASSQTERDQNTFLELLNDESIQIRTEAAAALAQPLTSTSTEIATKQQVFDPVSFQILASKNTSLELLESSKGRRLMLPTLFAKHQASAIHQFIKETKDNEAKLNAIAALGQCASSVEIQELRSLSKDQTYDETIRKAAYRAMRCAQRRLDNQKRFEVQP